MTDSEGLPFNDRQLADKVWIADFIYTQCPGPCPVMSSKMHRLSEQLKDDPDVRLVSFSVDPVHDTPPVLNGFAHNFGGPTKQWSFLTGTPETVHQIAYTTFHMGDIISKMDHSTRFALVDKNGFVRGYYDSNDPNDLATLLKDVEALR
jgi:protein SCO1/2